MRERSTKLKEHQTEHFLRKCLLPPRCAYQRLQGRRGRFAIYTYLRSVYAAYLDIRHHRLAKGLKKFASSEMRKSIRKGIHPIRIVMDATSTEPDTKVKSRWSRALQYALHEQVPANQLREFFRLHKGIAGCARRASDTMPVKWSPRGHWTE